jgi:heat shock protein HtpX
LVGATSAVMELCVDNPREGFTDLFATHPSVELRVDALVKYAGGHYLGPLALPMHPAEEPSDQSTPPDQTEGAPLPPPLTSGPWGQAAGPAGPAGASQGAGEDAPNRPWGNPAGPWGGR